MLAVNNLKMKLKNNSTCHSIKKNKILGRMNLVTQEEMQMKTTVTHIPLHTHQDGYYKKDGQ